MSAPTHLAKPPALRRRQAAFRQVGVTRATAAAGLEAETQRAT